jgi:tripartite-type tricarboxylate transporter receptor subunit TctC
MWHLLELRRKDFLCMIWVALMGAPLMSIAQTYPRQPIKLVVPYGAGSATDLLARRVAAPLSEVLGQGVVVENRAGANATLGTTYVAKSAPDGYTLLFGTTQTHAVNPNLLDNVPYDSLKDFQSVARMFNTGTVLVVSASLPVNNLEQLLAWIKANPKRANFGSTAYGTVSHLPSAYLSKISGMPMTHIPYNNAGQLMTDLARGEITMLFYPPDGVKAFIEAGTLKPLAWSGSKRHPQFSQVPTMIELGYPDFVFEAWYAIFAPAGTPPGVIHHLDEALSKVVKEPKFVQDVSAGSSVLYFAQASEMDQFLRAEVARFKRIASMIDKE